MASLACAADRATSIDAASGIASHVASEPLSAREVAVLRLVAVGKANKEVAWELGRAEET